MPYKDPVKQSNYQRDWIRQRRLDFFKDKWCEVCGETEGLRLHYKDHSEKTSQSVWSWSEDRRLAEIREKCYILCGPCETNQQNIDKLAPHGTSSRYRSLSYPCRCDDCTKAYSKQRKIENLRYRRKTLARTIANAIIFGNGFPSSLEDFDKAMAEHKRIQPIIIDVLSKKSRMK